MTVSEPQGRGLPAKPLAEGIARACPATPGTPSVSPLGLEQNVEMWGALVTWRHHWRSGMVKRRHPNSPTSPACGLRVYRKDTLRGNRVLSIYFGCLPWQGHWRKSSSLSKQRREMLILNKSLQMEKAGTYPTRLSLKTNGLDPNTTKPFQKAVSPSNPRT